MKHPGTVRAEHLKRRLAKASNNCGKDGDEPTPFYVHEPTAGELRSDKHHNEQEKVLVKIAQGADRYDHHEAAARHTKGVRRLGHKALASFYEPVAAWNAEREC